MGRGGDVRPFGSKIDGRGNAVDLVQLGLDPGAQAAHVIPPMANSNSAVSGAASVSGLAVATSITSHRPRP